MRARFPSKRDAAMWLSGIIDGEGYVAAGESDRVIADRFGVSAGAVWFWRRDYGLERGALAA